MYIMNYAVPDSWGNSIGAIQFKPFRKLANVVEELMDVAFHDDNDMKSISSTAGQNIIAPKKTRKEKSSECKTTGQIKAAREGRIRKQNPLTKVKNGKSLERIGNSLTSCSGKNSAANSLTNTLRENLLGGRFRYLNEQLYTVDSKAAEQLFDDREAFLAYHEGYRKQVNNWPVNPLNRIISMIKSLPKTLVIGDFGCGDGRLAQSVPNKVYSMDLVSTRSDITECNITNTPLQAISIDVAVYCLSLMGTNLRDYMLEANRVLRMGGLVYIAEIQSRFPNKNDFKQGVESCGFELVKIDSQVKLFFFFQFKKVRNVRKISTGQSFSLKPCLYRKR